MARCPDCNKFVSLDVSTEPDAGELDIDADGNLEGDIGIVLGCEQCGTELLEGTFTPELATLTDAFEAHKQDLSEHVVTVADMSNVTVTFTFTVEALPGQGRAMAMAIEQLHDEIEKAKAAGTITGHGPFQIIEVELPEHELELEAESELTTETRKRKTFYGHRTTLTITCSCGKFEHSEEVSDDMEASEMDELGG